MKTITEQKRRKNGVTPEKTGTTSNQQTNDTATFQNAIAQITNQSKPEGNAKQPYQSLLQIKRSETSTQPKLSDMLSGPIQKPNTSTQQSYQSPWQAQLNDIADKILNREEFSYDINEDPFYQHYKDQYISQGQTAMDDAVGQAAALTGGYDNSYAQSVGQQAYNKQLQQLNDIIPELFQLALDQYNQEGSNLYNQASLLSQLDSQEYGRYRDQVADDLWQQTFQYQKGRDQVADNQWQQTFQYQKGRDQVADNQWQQTFDEGIRQWEYEQGITGNSGNTGGGNGDGYTGGSGYDNGDYDSSVVSQAQSFVGADPDGKWGPNSSAAAEALGYNSLSKVVDAMNSGSNEITYPEFTGNTYDDAVDYLKENNIPVSGLMTQAEWQRHRNKGNSAGGEHEASSYEEYLAAYIFGKTH